MSDPHPIDPTGVWTVVVAGGSGSRFGGHKQLVPIAGRPCVAWSIDAARSMSTGVIVVLPADLLDADLGVDDPAITRVVGGASRSASVRAGLAAIPENAQVVLVHDAARPAVTAALFGRVVAAVRDGAAAVVPGIPVVDSLRHRERGALDREGVVAVQTPQGFAAAVLLAAHAGGGDASDDASLVEAAGHRVVIVDGEAANVKLTHVDDHITLARSIGARHGTSSPAVST